jgi:hypothetical protein
MMQVNHGKELLMAENRDPKPEGSWTEGWRKTGDMITSAMVIGKEGRRR